MRTLELTVYNFDELPEEIQNKAMADLSDINVDCEWYDGEFDYWHEKLEEFGFMEPTIYFSGFNSQGDGACFDCKSINLEHAWKFFKLDMENQQSWVNRRLQAHENWIYDYLFNYVTFEIRCVNSRYSHENSHVISSYSYSPTAGLLDEIHAEFENWLENFRRGLCMEIYQNLSDEYNHLISDEAIIETIRLNDYEFYADGQIA